MLRPTIVGVKNSGRLCFEYKLRASSHVVHRRQKKTLRKSGMIFAQLRICNDNMHS